ncbi:protein SSUH2 homolog isoform X3 [Oryctolagus cuniculus]|uniref:protein SSUH2 homolog isoform X3 n=1 Tax=Oryctolagus cuniculus TaxID=9986 RepID=UPI00387A4806
MDSFAGEADSEMELSFEAESPLAPPAELLERLPGHDWLLPGDGQQVFFPPPETPGRPQEQRSWSWFLRYSRVPTVTEEVAQEALLSFVSSKCCYGHAAAGDLVIRELKQQNLCRYRLETFSESRVSEWTFQPLTSEPGGGWPAERPLPQALGHQGPGAPAVPGRHQEAAGASLVPGQGMPQMPRAWAVQVQWMPWSGQGAVSVLQRRQAQSQAATAVPAVLRLRPAQGAPARPAPPARGRRSCYTSSSSSPCGRTACLSSCPSPGSAAPWSSLRRPRAKASSRTRTWWCTPLWTSPCRRLRGPPRGASQNTVPPWAPGHAS